MLENEVREIFDSPPVEKVVPAVLMDALKKKLDGKISQEELSVACATYSMQNHRREFSRVKQNPPPPAGYDRYIDYTRKLKENGEMMNPHEQQRVVREFTPYWEHADKIRNENLSNAEWVLFCRETLRNVDAPLAIQADEDLKGFIEHGFRLGDELVGLYLKSKEHPNGRYYRSENNHHG